MEAVTISTILTNVGSIVTSAVTWVNSFVGTIVGSPLLSLFCLIPVVGLGIGLLRRLIRV